MQTSILEDQKHLIMLLRSTFVPQCHSKTNQSAKETHFADFITPSHHSMALRTPFRAWQPTAQLVEAPPQCSSATFCQPHSSSTSSYAHSHHPPEAKEQRAAGGAYQIIWNHIAPHPAHIAQVLKHRVACLALVDDERILRQARKGLLYWHCRRACYWEGWGLLGGRVHPSGGTRWVLVLSLKLRLCYLRVGLRYRNNARLLVLALQWGVQCEVRGAGIYGGCG